jgi:hypothetical protein
MGYILTGCSAVGAGGFHGEPRVDAKGVEAMEALDDPEQLTDGVGFETD